VSTIFAATQAALLAALQAAPALAGGNISANRTRAIESGHAAEIVVRLDQAAGDEAGIGSAMYDWQTAYTVECYARAASAADPAAAVDALLADTWARLAALDTAATGADISLSPAIDWQYDGTTATPVVCAVLRLTARHSRTARNALTPL
jgi:hypothetical protein